MLRFLLLASVLMAAAWGEEGLVPVTRMRLPDMAASRERWAAGAFGQLWALEAMKPARAALVGWVDGLAVTPGAGLWAGLNDITEMDLSTFQRPGDERMVLRVRLATRAEAVMDALVGSSEVRSDGFHQRNGIWLRRDGEWIEAQNGSEPVAVPPPIAVEAVAGADSVGRVDVLAMAAQSDHEMEAVFEDLGFTEVRSEDRLDAGGLHSRIDLPGLSLPLRMVDADLLRRLPAKPLFVGALGIDGPRAATQLAALAERLPAVAAELGAMDDQAAEAGRPGWKPVLNGIDGTALLIVYPGSPMPGLTVALPADAQVDALVAALAEEAGADLSGASEGPVVLPGEGMMPFMLQVRRSAGHWWISSDAVNFAAISEGSATGFDPGPTLAALHGQPALALGQMDVPAFIDLVNGYFPFLQPALLQQAERGEGKEGRKRMAERLTAIQRALQAARGILTRPAGFILTADATGIHVDGDNAALAIMPPAMMAGMVGSILQVRRMANRVRVENNLRQIAVACIAFQGDKERMPVDFAELKQQEQLPEKLFSDPAAPKALVTPHFLYVRPVAEPASWQPLVIQDPACNRGRGCWLATGDGSAHWLAQPAADRVWAEAKRLAALPTAADPGIAPADWQAVQGDLERDNTLPGRAADAQAPAAP